MEDFSGFPACHAGHTDVMAARKFDNRRSNTDSFRWQRLFIKRMLGFEAKIDVNQERVILHAPRQDIGPANIDAGEFRELSPAS